ncbi:MAG: hypothetical protein ACQEP5_02975 [Actinomycetota bacterium]
MVDKCKLCEKDLPEDSDSPYCEDCDEMLDKKFDKIEEDIVVYKDLTEEEIDTLKKFDTEDILELYASTYTRFAQEGQITEKEEKLLEKIKKIFNLKQKDIEEKIEVFKKMGTEICPECHEPINEDFNLCPYCAHKLKDDFQLQTDKDTGQPPYQDIWGPMLKNPGCLIILALIIVAVIVYFIYRMTSL